MNKTYLSHHGIKGQRWGVRRFQNDDGTLTSAGKKRYDVNEDGTARLNSKYKKGQNIRGIAKTAVGASMLTKSITNISKAKKSKLDFTSKDGKKVLNNAIFGIALGSIVIGSGVKNFINANFNKSFNTVGMGSTPENFNGKAKTRAQVLAQQNRDKNKK